MTASAYLKCPTWLYHPALARAGRIFDGSPERPIPHPGGDWVSSPADLPDAAEAGNDAEAALTARQLATELGDANHKLTEDKAGAIARAEAAEASNGELKVLLSGEKEAHAATEAKLDEARNEVVVLAEKVKELAADADQVPALQQALATANADNAALTAKLEAVDKAKK